MAVPLAPLQVSTTTTVNGTFAAALYPDRTIVFSRANKGKGTHIAAMGGPRAAPTVTGFRLTAYGAARTAASDTTGFPTTTEFTALVALLATQANSDLCDAAFTHPETWG